MNIVLFGAPGTGKGTQSDLLVSHFKLYHISTGDLFRKALSEKTALGLKARSYMDQGQLVPDFVVTSMVEEIFNSPTFAVDASKGFILDGFPRTIAQAKVLDTLLAKYKRPLDQVLCLNVSQSELIERLTGRRIAMKSGHVYHILFHPPKKEGVCDISGEQLIHRKDDTKYVVQNRLAAYQQQTAPLIAYYRNQNILVDMDGTGTKEEVFARIKKIIA